MSCPPTDHSAEDPISTLTRQLDQTELAACAGALLEPELPELTSIVGEQLIALTTAVMVRAAQGEPVSAQALEALEDAARAVSRREASAGAMLRAAELIAALVWQAAMDLVEEEGDGAPADGAAKLSLALLDASTAVSTAFVTGVLGDDSSADAAA